MKRIIILLIFLWDAEFSALDLELKSRVFVKKSEILLSELCDIISENDSLGEDLQHLEIINLPYSLKSKNIYASELEDLIYQKTGRYIKVNGGVCVIRWEQKTVPENELIKLIKKFIRKTFKISDKMVISLKRLPKIAVPVENYRIEFEKPHLKKNYKIAQIKGKIFHLEEVVSKFTVPVQIEIINKVAVLDSDVKRHGALKNHVVLKEEKTPVIHNCIDSYNDLTDIRAKRFLRKGTVLTDLNTETIPDVLRNQKLKVAVKSGRVKLEIDAVAKKDAYIGETVLCLNPESKKKFKALVKNRNFAVIKLEE
ncbi:MAG: flagella basal body P-ring formation protein FlgA [Candidatus Cloacimonadota bacterium]|nr:MAG: flagella basal body P-ring formation protein FlgA [Candidatus Cloacimonadota bacterium]